MTAFIYEATHEIYYSNKEAVPLSEIAESLLALEQILRISPRVLACLTSSEIDRVDVFIDEIRSGSLFEKVLIRYCFKDEDGLNAFVDKVKDKVGGGVKGSVLIGASIAAVLGYGAWMAGKAMNAPSQTTINANNNNIFVVGADAAKIAPEAFKAIVEAAIPDKKSLAENSVKVFKPARADSSASISIDGADALSFPPAVIAATPTKVEFGKQDKTESLPDVDLHIRATNLDSRKIGWAGLIPGKVEKRIRLQIDPSVEFEDIAGKYSLRANVILVYKLGKDGKEMVPDYILLRDVIKD